MNIKIHGGTVKGGNLCDSCRYNTRIKGFGESQEIRFCVGVGDGGKIPLTFSVAKCDSYMRRGTVFLSDLEKMAIILDGSHTRVKGFKQD